MKQRESGQNVRVARVPQVPRAFSNVFSRASRSMSARRGFTIVELLIYIGIFSILITVMAQIFSAIVDSQLDSESTTNVAQGAQYVYSRLIYDVHHAQSISTPSALGDSSATLVVTSNGKTYTYGLNGSTLEVNDGTSSYALSSYDTEVSNLQFQRIGNIGGKHTVRISFTIKSVGSGQGGQESRSIQTTAGLR